MGRVLTFDDMNLTEPLRIYGKKMADTRTVAEYVDSFASLRSTVHDGDLAIPKVPMDEPLRADCEHFVECVVEGRTPLADGRNGLAGVRAVDAVRRSPAGGGRHEAI